MRVFVATPAYQGKVDGLYAQSLCAATQDLVRHDIEMYVAILANAMFIEHARNVLADSFLKTDATHLMFIDGDIGFEPHAIRSLLTDDVTAGVCPQRDTNEFRCRPTGEKRDGWIGMNRVGTGFLCIPRDVVDRMSAESPIVNGVPWMFHTKISDDSLVGEDYSWCDDYGDTIWVLPELIFNHAGRVDCLSKHIE